jgi:hypothetical protein
MIRKQVYLRADQDRRLKALARTLGVSEAELIRQSVDRSVLGAGLNRPDPAAWAAERRLVAARQARRRLRGRRDWTRDDLYSGRGLPRH